MFQLVLFGGGGGGGDSWNLDFRRSSLWTSWDIPSVPALHGTMAGTGTRTLCMGLLGMYKVIPEFVRILWQSWTFMQYWILSIDFFSFRFCHFCLANEKL